MHKKFPALLLVITLVCTFGGTSVFAQTSGDPEVKPETLAIEEGPDAPPESHVMANEKLKVRMLALVAEAKAGKVAPAKHPQTQPATTNNLSKGTKIAIGVGIAVAVAAVILVVTRPRLTGPIL